MAEDFALRFRGAGEDPEPVGTIGHMALHL
jgi:hypothetical protein